MRYAWVITRDFIADEDEPKGTYLNAPGVAGPSDATDEEIALARKGHLFRLVDGDGNVYYHGRIWCEDGDEPVVGILYPSEGYGRKPYFLTYGPSADERAAFGPLWDFGTPNAGCVDIQYRVTTYVTKADRDTQLPTKPVWASL